MNMYNPMNDSSNSHSSGARGFREALEGHALNAMLVAESNHRIANNLSIIGGLVRQQARDVAKETRSFSAEEVMRLLNEVSQRIDMVGRFHRLLAQPAEDNVVDLGEYLHEIAAAAIGSMAGEGDVTLEPISSDGCDIHASQALLVGFVVGELVTNSVKYAHPAQVKGKVGLTCERVDGATRITLADDGVGLPDGLDPQKGGGMGLRMTRLLAQQLRARLSFQSSELGLTVELLVPRETGPDLSTLHNGARRH
jgi:two-component sensor histidine kinase